MSLVLDPAHGIEAGLRALALDQLGRIAAAARTIPTDPARGPHATRKEIKKLRALIRLLARFSADAGVENHRWRLVAASLAQLREAAALVETVDRFLARLARADPLRPELAALRGRFEARLAEMAADDRFLSALDENCRDAASACEETLTAFPWQNDELRAAELLAEGVLGNWREARKALRRARRHRREDDFHDLRKAVKRHAADRNLLRLAWSGGAGRRRRVEALGDILGELNDVFVLMAMRKEIGGSRAFGRLLARMRRKLAARALGLAGRVFDKRPRGLAARLARKLRVKPAEVPGAQIRRAA